MEEENKTTEIALFLKYYKDSEINKYAYMVYRHLYRKWFCAGFVVGLVIASVIAVLVQ